MQEVEDVEKMTRTTKIGSFLEFMKTFFKMTKEEFDEMDHKLLRIFMSVASFGAAAVFWLYFMRHVAVL